ncbi:hypothetical protein [Siphonobacter sp. BAB-5385]|uniref:hypothetical protein n=1 Tax=Siphonobacter sp. BAB-5385 TaxID=1864822 RepID=UPI0015950FF6|nr:hypothetical protein [Siphonobacter sp. BAB-5385]
MDLQNNRIGYGYGATSINFYGLFGARTIRETFVQKAQAGEMFVWIVQGHQRSSVAKRTFNQ